MTREWFTAQMARMAGLRFPPADLETHWEGLSDLPEAVLQASVARAIRTRVEFPTPAELREDADVVAPSLREMDPSRSRTVDLPVPMTMGTLPTGTPIVARRTYTPVCERCQDTGFAPVDDSERPNAVTPCVCRATNPVLVRRRQAQARYAEARERRR